MNFSKSIIAIGSIVFSSSAFALEWSDTEVQYQYGEQDIPFSGGETQDTAIVTLQHASGWRYGDTFAFVDFSDGDETGHDIYGEIYANFSLGKITGRDLSVGPIRDFGIIAGYNWGDDAKTRKYLPGVRLALDVPGFKFLNVDTTAYIDDNEGVRHDGAPKEDDSYMVDVNWALPFSIQDHDFSFEGHVEYIGSRDNEFGEKVKAHVLAQPQLTYDLGKTLFEQPDKLRVGVEFQFWNNKYGDEHTDERLTQLLVVYNF